MLTALFLGEHGRHGEALPLWYKALALSPDDFDVVFNLASALRQMGRNTEAVSAYEKAASLAPQVSDCHTYLMCAAFLLEE